MDLRYILWGIILVVGVGCAQMRAPTGGEKDVTPPQVLQSTPHPEQLNFTEQNIQLEFDEFVELKEQSQILISPRLEGDLEFKNKGKTITVVFPEALQDSVTYQIYFGNAIVDFREGNVLENFSLAWSTFDVLDTLTLTGKVLGGEWSDPQEGWVVAAFEDVDSVWLKSPALRLSRTDKNGAFVLSNLRQKQYRLAAWNDANFNNIWDGVSEPLGFSPHTFVPTPDSTEIITLFAQQQKDSTGVLKYEMKKEREIWVHKNPFFPDLSIAWSQSDIFMDSLIQSDSVLYWIDPTTKGDSLLGTSNYGDTMLFYFSGFNKETALEVESNLKGKMQFSEKYFFHFSEPIKQDSIVFQLLLPDSTDAPELLQWSSQDSIPQQDWFFTLPDTLTQAALVFQDSAFRSVYGSWVKATTFAIAPTTEEQYGRFMVQLDTLVSGTLEFYESNTKIWSTPVTSKTIESPLLRSGKYQIRILEDRIENEKWDGPQWNFNFEGERIWTYPKKVQLRANWDLELDWQLTEKDK